MRDDASLIERLKTCAADVPVFDLAGRTMAARLIEAYDGDSLKMVFEFDGDMFKVMTRLIGIDTPEIRSKNAAERAAAVTARNFAVRACGLATDLASPTSKVSVTKALRATPVIVRLECHKNDKYGRTLCTVYPMGDEVSVNQRLLDAGLAVPYGGGKKEEWLHDGHPSQYLAQ